MSDGAPGLTPARRTLLLIVALLTLPFAVAFGLYWVEWRPAALGNHGELIQPPQPLPENGLQRIDGRPLPTSALRGKWTLVRVSRGTCDDACRNDLRHMRQVQVSLNKEMMRLQRVLLTDTPSDPALPELRRLYPDLLVAAASAGHDGDPWRASMGDGAHLYYVIDPLANVMMRYSDNPDPQGMRKDLERLLKYSWVG